LSTAFILVASVVSAGITGVFVHAFLGSKPFKLMDPPWLPTLLAVVSVAGAVGSIATAWRFMRRFPYAMPLVASCSTIVIQVLFPAVLCRIVIGGSGEGDLGWRAAADELLLEARGLLKPVLLLATVIGVIGVWCRKIWPGD